MQKINTNDFYRKQAYAEFKKHFMKSYGATRINKKTHELEDNPNYDPVKLRQIGLYYGRSLQQLKKTVKGTQYEGENVYRFYANYESARAIRKNRLVQGLTSKVDTEEQLFRERLANFREVWAKGMTDTPEGRKLEEMFVKYEHGMVSRQDLLESIKTFRDTYTPYIAGYGTNEG